MNVGGWWVTDKTRTSPAVTLERREFFVLIFPEVTMRVTVKFLI